MDVILDLLRFYFDHIISVLGFVFDPSQRMYALYLLSAVVVAFVLFWTKKAQITSGPATPESESSFVRFLFPKHVWSHPSAWLDVRYFFFHRLTGHLLVVLATASCLAWGFALVTGGQSVAEAAEQAAGTSSGWVAGAVFMFVFFMFGDLIAYSLHAMQHRIPLLWEFHKVHHSAEVMHPMSNHREHPVDNLLYKAVIGFLNGVLLGVTYHLVGHEPLMPSLIGLPVLMFLFNVVGYNLRHSHVWLKWPGVWSKLLPSPAHHHVHHSQHPDHIDKNFAFMFPMWDVVFGTYEVPETNEDVKFGVHGIKPGELDTCVGLYVDPFKQVVRNSRAKRQKRHHADAPAQPAEATVDPRSTVTSS